VNQLEIRSSCKAILNPTTKFKANKNQHTTDTENHLTFHHVV
jgi:hypothetical protein